VRDAVATVLAVLDRPEAATGGDALVTAVTAASVAVDARYRESSAALGRHTAELIPDGATVLTHCWADQFLIGAVTAAQHAGKQLRFVCTETRPYLQGARLTAATLVEMGYTPTLITDGMVASVLASGDVDVLLTAADRVTLDGHVVNKVGTLTAALAAHRFDVPYYAMVDHPDRQSPTIGDVRIEERDGDEVLRFEGRRTTADGVVGRYPAFDATPPELVTKIVTDRGAFAPADIGTYFS
jgi:methylthioribose-1-phosphate isomerase